MELRVIETELAEKEAVSLKSPKPKEAKVYEAEKNEVSKNIKKFDKKAEVYRDNPYSFNSVSLKQRSAPPTQTASQMIANKTYNMMGKLLGIDTIHDWNKQYDKVYTITEWAKSKSKLDNPVALMRWIRSRHIPTLGARKLDDLYIYARMQMKV